jgi:cyclophilin family peptidyl-prolyl cis-trans isomerase
MPSIRPYLFVASCVLAVWVRAQTGTPTLAQPIPAQTMSTSGGAVTLDLRSYFAVPGAVGPKYAQFDTIFGRFNVELRNDIAPRHVANFLAYAQAGSYTNTFFHRAAALDASGSVSIVQGGGYGYKLPFEITTVTKLAPIALEYNLANARGTLAAARTSDVNSATSEWYINTRDNSTILGVTNGGGYSVFGRVLGTGMTVVDAIAALPRYNVGSPFTELPLRNVSGSSANETNLIIVNSVREASLFPSGNAPAVVDLTVQNSSAGVVSATIVNSTLTLTPIAAGTATVTVRAVDTNGNAATGTIGVTVAAGTLEFVSQPRSQGVAAGSTVVFEAPTTISATYRWERDGVPVAGATGSTLVIRNAAAADAGSYVLLASTASGTKASAAATLAVANADPVATGRLVNLSILTTAGAGARVLTIGAVIGSGDPAGALPLVIRAVGPTLAQPPFNVSGVLADPTMTFYAEGNGTPIDANDNWGGGAALSAAFASVAAFALPTASLDSAFVRTSPGVAAGAYTVQVTGKSDATGVVIAEIYDAVGGARSAATPRLVNLSTRALIDPKTDLAVGFVIGGTTARTVLVRGVGPSLAAFGVTGTMTDPRLDLFDNNTAQRVATNDDWGGAPELAAAAGSVGAFALAGGTSKDAVLFVTLAPGPYSARVSGADGGGGVALVEVYEVR